MFKRFAWLWVAVWLIGFGTEARAATDLICTGCVDVADMATTGTAADDKAFVADSSTAGTWRTITDCTDTGGNHLNYTQSSNSFSCGTSAPGANVAVGTFTRSHSAASDTQTVPSVGLTPAIVFLNCGFTTANDEGSVGFSNSTTDFSIANTNDVSLGAGTWTANASVAANLEEDNTKNYQGNVGNFVSDEFDVVWARQGSTAAGTITCGYVAFD